MPKKMETLKIEALKACKNRSHKMSRFTTLTPTTAFARCVDCGKGVQIDTHPLPNGIDISGEAVALNCAPFDKIVLDLLAFASCGLPFVNNVSAIAAMKKALAAKYEIDDWTNVIPVLEKRFNPQV